MNPETITQLANECLLLVLQLSAPMVLSAALVGLLLGFLQAVTQLQDQTTTFAIKLVVTLLALLFTLPWLGVELSNYSNRIFDLLARVAV